jgi:hypothetical protein
MRDGTFYGFGGCEIALSLMRRTTFAVPNFILPLLFIWMPAFVSRVHTLLTHVLFSPLFYAVDVGLVRVFTDAVADIEVGRALFTEDVMLFVRREIRHKHGILVSVEDIANAIHSMFTDAAKERIGPPKIRIRKAKKIDSAASASAALELSASQKNDDLTGKLQSELQLYSANRPLRDPPQ